VTLQGNIFNGANQLAQFNSNGDLQIGVSSASTFSAGGYMTLAGLNSAPTPAVGRLYLDLAFGGLKISTNGISFVALSTVTGPLTSISANALQFTGSGTAGSPLGLQVSSVTLQGNAFNGPSELVQLLSNGVLPALNGSLLTNIAASDPTKLPLAGGTLVGQLTISGATLTVTGNAFSVGGSTFVVTNGSVAIGTTFPQNALDVNGVAQAAKPAPRRSARMPTRTWLSSREVRKRCGSATGRGISASARRRRRPCWTSTTARSRFAERTRGSA
jgi:hypothetical protein